MRRLDLIKIDSWDMLIPSKLKADAIVIEFDNSELKPITLKNYKFVGSIRNYLDTYGKIKAYVYIANDVSRNIIFTTQLSDRRYIYFRKNDLLISMFTSIDDYRTSLLKEILELFIKGNREVVKIVTDSYYINFLIRDLLIPILPWTVTKTDLDFLIINSFKHFNNYNIVKVVKSELEVLSILINGKKFYEIGVTDVRISEHINALRKVVDNSYDLKNLKY
jgi:hypothetical protein